LGPAMSEGDFVVYVADPWRYGNLIVCDFTRDGKLVVQDATGDTHTFHALDLELEEEWAKGQLTGTWAAWQESKGGT
jgi:hypothetical protein